MVLLQGLIVVAFEWVAVALRSLVVHACQTHMRHSHIHMCCCPVVVCALLV